MKTSETSVSTGLDRMNGLLAWWGMPNVFDGSEMEAQAKQFQVLVVELNKLFNEASSRQAQSLSAANEQFSHALQELLSARQPSELMAAQSRLVTAFMESLTTQTNAWAELTQKMHNCCSTIVREAAAEAGERVGRLVPIRSQAMADRPTGKASGNHAA